MYKTFFGLTTASGASVGVHAFDPVKLTATLVVNATADGDVISTGKLTLSPSLSSCCEIDAQLRQVK